MLRVATFNTELFRAGPGLLLRDIRKDNDPQVTAVLDVLREASADVVVLQGVDYDLGNRALEALAKRAGYPHHFALRPNAGLATELDLDGDGRTGGPGDAQGYGAFSGQAGMGILSRHPINSTDVRDYTDVLWRNIPGALLPMTNGKPFPSAEAQKIQRLSNMGHWIVPVAVAADATLQLMTFHATPPVFDGPEDRNGRRNHDEIRFWQHVLDGTFGPAPASPFVLLGQTNQDPEQGEGRKDAIRGLLADPRFQDPQPHGAMGLATVDWSDIDLGAFRVSYVLPSQDIRIIDAGVVWPDADDPFLDAVTQASRHRLVWIDLVVAH